MNSEEQTMAGEFVVKKLKKVVAVCAGVIFILVTVHYKLVRPQPVVIPTKDHLHDVSYTRMFNHNKPLSRRPNKTEAGDKALITMIQDFQSKRHKGKPKQVHLTPQTDVNMTDIKRIFSTTWRGNKTNFMSVRSELDSLVNTHEYFTVTQENTKAGENLTMAHQDKVSRTVFHDIHARLPKESPFKGVTFPRCVVMGSSGLLDNSHCGSEIDNADYVFRCNMPPIKDFKDDAGARSNLTTMNVMSIVADRYHLLFNSLEEDKFLRDLEEYSGHFWLPVFGMGSTYSFGLRVLRFLDTKLNGTNLQVLVGHPEHFRKIKQFWEAKGIVHRPSTGLYLTTTAIALCDNVDLYGFWPLPIDIHGNQVKYHYYEDKPSPTIMHDFHLEFLHLAHLHEQGVIQIHAGKCKDDLKRH